MAASNRPMFCLSAMSATLRKVRAIANGVFSAKARRTCYLPAMHVHVHVHMHIWQADLNPQHSARIDASISVLVDLTGANERIFKSPIPL